MSIKLALLKSGEEVIADISEFRQKETDILISYLFKKPYCIKIKTSQVLVEDESRPKHELAYYKWMTLSKDNDIIVNKDWVVCITEPLDSVKKNYEEKMNGRRSNDTDGSTDGSRSGTSEPDPSLILNESNDFDI
jgi:hypothetical protein|tara:strand:+ start:65 stop:469 length:405 start_codon:yes stop_codon:yes gene_type:complete